MFKFLIRSISNVSRVLTVPKHFKTLTRLALVPVVMVSDPSLTLSHEFLVKQNAIQVVHSVTNLMTQITCSLLDAYTDYATAMEQLIVLMESRLEFVNGKNEQVEDLILETRNEIQEQAIKTNKLEMQINVITRLVDVTAEAAFSTGAEYPAIATNERLISSQGQLKQCRERIEALKQCLVDLEAKTVQNSE